MELHWKANGIEDPHNLQIGQEIWIPRTYQIKKGDTLYSISKHYGVSIEAMHCANGIEDPNLIHEGNVWKQRLGLFCLVEHRGSAAAPAFAVILGGVHVSWCVTNDVPRSSWTFPADVSPSVAVTAAAPFGRVWAWATGFCFWRSSHAAHVSDVNCIRKSCHLLE